MPKLRYQTTAPAPAFIRAIAPVLALLSVLIPIMTVETFAAVPVQINSGDPAFPFPQFLPYGHPNGDTLYNLGTHNPAGVVHAEMEKSIRDAYQIMMNRAGYYQNITFNGVKYIKFKSNPDCSEGTGYAMLAAAMMADKVTFDGLWLFTHDFAMNKVVRYRDGTNAPKYDWSVLPDWTNAAGGNSATDGDVDIALALMIAYKQWGEFMGINDFKGNKISYKADFLKVIKGLSDSLSYTNGNLLSGDIGFDGYLKNGDSWSELTGWSQNMQNLSTIGVNKGVQKPGPEYLYFDYSAPAYFRQFADYMEAENAAAYGWNISQFRRAEASCDWLMGKLYAQNPKNIPVLGNVTIEKDTTPVFGKFNEGEDFRAGWRTVLNYVWHGNPRSTWNPVSHTVVNKANTFQRDMGQRYAKFLWNRRQAPWDTLYKTCETIRGEGAWWGPSMLKQDYTIDGKVIGTHPLNWIHGTGSPSAVTAQNADLMAEMYRQAELEWDIEAPLEPGDTYLKSVPHYYHGFFRLLGMTILTGNHHAPLNMKRSANMKVYLDVNKTYAFEDDTIAYTIDYRNYGADEAKGVRIVDKLHPDFVFISGTGSPSYDAASNTVTWNIGNVTGFKTSTGVNPTKGTVTLKVKIPNAKFKRYENKVDISCTNGSGWTSNEYPNKISSVMKRTGVDIASRALRVEHSLSRDTVNPGMAVVYTIDFENSAKAGWLNGGRPGVNFSYAHDGTAANAGSHTFQLRAFHDAHEAYIDYGNYRISYFLFDNNYKGLGADGWNVRTDILYVPAAEKSKFKLLQENITPGEDAKYGKWNQRLILQVADVLDTIHRSPDTNWGTMAAPTQFLINYSGGAGGHVHRGIDTPFKGVWAVYAGNYANRNWGGDWSYNSKAKSNIATDAMADWGYPITPDFTDDPSPNNPGKDVKLVHRKLCGVSPASTTIDNVLIEEWDGYTWRRVFGNGPLPGREVLKVVIRDTLPPGVTFLNFIEPYPFGKAPKITGRVITWEIDKLLVGEKGSIKYAVRADTVPAAGKNVVLPSRVWASADKESPMKGAVTLVVTKDSLPPPPPEPTTMYKRANKSAYSPGDTVVYTVAYKQTHGYPAVSSSSSQWEGTNKPISGDGKTISFGNSNVDMRFTPASGTNVTLTGAMFPERYGTAFYIFARRTAQGSVELKFDRKYVQGESLEGILVTLTSNGRVLDSVGVPMATSEASINYKFVFKNDSLLMWMGDTATAIPFRVTKGIAVQKGDAGVRYTSNGANSSSKIVNWASRSDLAYNVTIRDTVPFGVKLIGSPTGSINTGTLARKSLTGVVNGNVITWQVVSGDTALGVNDSLTVTWRGIVDTSKTGSVVNTAYADLAGYPKDAVGAQVRSKFSVVKGPDDPDPPDPPDPPKGELTLQVAPPGYPAAFMFSGSVKVTLSSSRSDASVWYTVNGQAPDSATWPFITKRYTGPINIEEATTLRAVAYADGCEPLFTDTHVYRPLNTVPILHAIFYDNVGDGYAHGVKLVISPGYRSDLNESIVSAHPELLSLSLIGSENLPEMGAMRFAGDTIEVQFKSGAKLGPRLSNVKLKISDPPLPDSRYAIADGYLAGCELPVTDGVVAVITKAVYYVGSNILSVTFNKLPGVYSDADTSVRLVPFILSYSGGTYYFECKTSPQQEGDKTYNFVVTGIKGDNPPSSGVPSDGDSIRVMVWDNARGIWQRDPSIVQRNKNNTAVALKVRYPELKYDVKMGPNPSRDTVLIFVGVEFEDAAQSVSNAGPYMQSVLDGSGIKAVILDKIGGLVTVIEPKTGKGDGMDKKRRVLVWDGCNYKGRKVGTGTYLIMVTITDQEGNKKTERNKVYIVRKKGR